MLSKILQKTFSLIRMQNLTQIVMNLGVLKKHTLFHLEYLLPNHFSVFIFLVNRMISDLRIYFVFRMN